MAAQACESPSPIQPTPTADQQAAVETVVDEIHQTGKVAFSHLKALRFDDLTTDQVDILLFALMQTTNPVTMDVPARSFARRMLRTPAATPYVQRLKLLAAVPPGSQFRIFRTTQPPQAVLDRATLRLGEIVDNVTMRGQSLTNQYCRLPRIIPDDLYGYIVSAVLLTSQTFDTPDAGITTFYQTLEDRAVERQSLVRTRAMVAVLATLG